MAASGVGARFARRDQRAFRGADQGRVSVNDSALTRVAS
jgi:hypothetical protein